MRNLLELPADLPVPEDDGACAHLEGMMMPAISLESTSGSLVKLAETRGRTVVYCFPRMGQPDQPVPKNWDAIPGARGCTPQSCSFRDHYQELTAAGTSHVFGLSAQDTDYQREAVERLHLPFSLLSDLELHLANALKLPTFRFDSMTLIKRLTLIIDDGRITKVFYPVFPPDKSAEQTLQWLMKNPAARWSARAHGVSHIVSPRIITLLTDFGTEDYFVGAMKGVILTRSPEAVIVDVTHAIPSQDVRAGAFILSAVYDNFPAGSIHLAVVDPGVGSDRRPVLIEAADYLFVGPDNGLFSLVLDRVPGAKVRHVTNTNYFLPDRSSTFHGRDIFAPVAAALAQGVRPGELGPIIQDPVRFGSSECELLADGTIVGRVIHIDHFGNCVTNFAWKQLQHLLIAKPFCLRVKEHEIQKRLRYYSEATTQLPFVIVGSAGFLEISIRCSSAAGELKIAVGDPVRLACIPQNSCNS